MKIRQYVMDLIATGEGKPQKIPSSRKLGEMFGVTHPTALRAIQVLTEDGHLIPLPGGGSITARLTADQKPHRIFGILTEDGKVAYENYYHYRILSAVGLNLTRQSEHACAQNIYLNTASDLERVILHNHICGLFLLGIRRESLLREIAALQSRAFPMVSMIVQIPNISSYYTMNSDCCGEMLRKLFSEGRRQIIVLIEPLTQSIDGVEEVICGVCAECGVPRGNVLVIYDSAMSALERIRELYAFGMRFDGVVLFRNMSPFFSELKKIVDVEEECRVVNLEYSVFEDVHFTGYSLKFDLDSAAKHLISNIFEQIHGKKTPWIQEKLNVSFEFYKNGQPTGKDSDK